MKAYIEPYVPQMRDEVVNLKLREADVVEVKASLNMNPKQAIEESIDNSSILWIIKYDNKIIAVFGVARLNQTTGIPWLLGSTELHKIKFRIIKYSQLVVDNMFFYDNDVKCLTNYVSVEHTDAIKWLKWLGFTISEDVTFLSDTTIPFKQFYKWRKEGS